MTRGWSLGLHEHLWMLWHVGGGVGPNKWLISLFIDLIAVCIHHSGQAPLGGRSAPRRSFVTAVRPSARLQVSQTEIWILASASPLRGWTRAATKITKMRPGRTLSSHRPLLYSSAAHENLLEVLRACFLRRRSTITTTTNFHSNFYFYLWRDFTGICENNKSWRVPL